MFRGRFQHSIDAKGRLNFPAKFREILVNNYEEKLIVVKYPPCLRAYPLSEWLAFEKSQGSQYRNKAQEDTLRMVFSSAAECGFDKQGRILIPQNLREFAGLTKEVVLIGILKKIEIWDRERFEEHDARIQESQELGEVLTQLGL